MKGLSIFSLRFFQITENSIEYLVEYDSFDNSKSSFQVGAGILSLLLLYDLFMFFHV